MDMIFNDHPIQAWFNPTMGKFNSTTQKCDLEGKKQKKTSDLENGNNSLD